MPLYRSSTIIPAFTWATLPLASVFGIGKVFISDVGTTGSIWWSNGTLWQPDNRVLLFEENTGFIVPALAAANAATYSQTLTTVTVTSAAHNIPTAIHNGKNCNLVNNSVLTGVAPTGYSGNWFTNFQYVDANTFTVTATNSQTATGTLATTTTAQTLPISFILKGGVMGLSGKIDAYILQSHNNSAGGKYVRLHFGGTEWFKTNGTTNISLSAYRWLKNRGVTNAQAGAVSTAMTFGAGSSTDNVRLAINTAADVTHTFVMTAPAANDYVALDQLSMSLSYN